GEALSLCVLQTQSTKALCHRNWKQQRNDERDAAAPSPDCRRRWFDGEQQQSHHAKTQRKKGIGEQKSQPKFVDRQPFVHGLAAKNNDDTGETGKSNSNLRRHAESFTRFHTDNSTLGDELRKNYFVDNFLPTTKRKE